MKRCMKYVVGVLVFTCFVIAIAYIIAKISYINKVKSYLDNKYPGVEFSVVDINYSILSESMLARVEEEHRSLIFSVSNLNSNLSDDYEEVLVEANIIDEIGIIIQTNDLQGDVGRVEVSYLALDENFMDSWTVVNKMDTLYENISERSGLGLLPV